MKCVKNARDQDREGERERKRERSETFSLRNQLTVKTKRMGQHLNDVLIDTFIECILFSYPRTLVQSLQIFTFVV